MRRRARPGSGKSLSGGLSAVSGLGRTILPEAPNVTAGPVILVVNAVKLIAGISKFVVILHR